MRDPPRPGGGRSYKSRLPVLKIPASPLFSSGLVITTRAGRSVNAGLSRKLAWTLAGDSTMTTMSRWQGTSVFNSAFPGALPAALFTWSLLCGRREVRKKGLATSGKVIPSIKIAWSAWVHIPANSRRCACSVAARRAGSLLGSWYRRSSDRGCDSALVNQLMEWQGRA